MSRKKKTSIHLISDTHLAPVISPLSSHHDRVDVSSLAQEVFSSLAKKKDTKSPDSVLILAGDIGDSYSDSYRRLLLAARDAYRTVLLIPGNHEYYTDGRYDMSVVKEHLERLTKETGIILLDNADVVVNGIRFVGSTCWPIVPEEQFKVLKREGYGLVTRISKDSHRLDPSDFKKLHDTDVAYLEETVKNSKEPCVVITHYPPNTMMINDAFEHSSQISLHYNIDLIDRIAKTQGATPLWCCGHCHTSKRMWTRGMNTLLVANCVEGGNYDPEFIVELQA